MTEKKRSVKPSVTVLVPSLRGHEHKLKRVVEAVLQQQKISIEVWIMGNAELESIEDFPDLLSDQRVFWWVTQEENISLTSLLKQCIRRARGEWIACASEDVIWLPEHLFLHVEQLMNPGFMVTQSAIRSMDDHATSSHAPADLFATMVWDKRLLSSLLRNIQMSGSEGCSIGSLFKEIMRSRVQVEIIPDETACSSFIDIDGVLKQKNALHSHVRTYHTSMSYTSRSLLFHFGEKPALWVAVGNAIRRLMNISFRQSKPSLRPGSSSR